MRVNNLLKVTTRHLSVIAGWDLNLRPASDQETDTLSRLTVCDCDVGKYIAKCLKSAALLHSRPRLMILIGDFMHHSCLTVVMATSCDVIESI